MQATIHDSRGDALLSRQTPHERTLQHEEAIGIFGAIATVSVLPGNAVERSIGSNEQDAAWRFVKSFAGGASCRKQRLVDGFAIRYRVSEWLRRPRFFAGY